MTMFNQVIELTKISKVYFQNQFQRRLYLDTSLITSCLLFTLCAIVTSQQYFGKPIECLQHVKGDKSIPESVLNKFCFISSTYTAVNFFDHKVSNKTGTKHSFYPWVPLVLLLQGLSFLLPQNVWSYIDGGFFEHCLRDNNSLFVDYKKLLPLGRYLAKRMTTFRVWSLGCLLSEFIYIVNIILNLFLTDAFLGGNFFQYGLQVFYKENSVEHVLFPSMTRCSFHKYGPSGTLENRDALCVMTLNMWNEKFYLFLWFWFSFLLAISIIFAVHRIFFLIIIMMRNKCICLIRLMLTPTLECNGMFILISRLTITDWIFIQQLKRSMEPAAYSKILEIIVAEISEIYNIKHNCIMVPNAIHHKPFVHSNSNV